MDLGLKGKRSLVTGSTAGIGFAAARALAAEGAEVIINGRTQSRIDHALRQLGQQRRERRERAFPEAERRHERVRAPVDLMS